MLLRPHLPNDLPTMTLGPLQVGTAAASFSPEQSPRTLNLAVRSEAEEAFTLTVELPVPVAATEVTSSRLGGEEAGALTTLPGGERIVRFDAVELEPGQTLNFSLVLRREIP